MAPHQPKMMLGWILKLCLVALLSNPTGVLGYTTNLRGAVKTTEADAADAHADAHADAEAEAVVSFDESFDEVPEMEEVELSEDEDEEEDEDEDEALEEDEDEDEALEEQEDEWEDEDEDFEKYILEDEDLSEEELMELREQRQLHPDHSGVINNFNNINYSRYYHGNGLYPVNSFNGGVNSFNGGSISLNRPVRNNRFRFYNNYQYQANYIRPQASYWGSGSYLNQDRYYGYYSPYGTNGARYGPYAYDNTGYWGGNW